MSKHTRHKKINDLCYIYEEVKKEKYIGPCKEHSRPKNKPGRKKA